MLKILFVFILASSITSNFFEEPFDFTLTIDFNGLNENEIEDELNKAIIASIDCQEYIFAAMVSYEQIRKGNNIVKKCKRFLPEQKTLQMIVKSVCDSNINIKDSKSLSITFKTSITRAPEGNSFPNDNKGRMIVSNICSN